ncbi:hypothetical protein PSU4_36980 [Pseudonocardia sulfidoxydans NBRC 16205]|uniref:Uncharacterized protein n=1 Tax=Pseudonocardia sulfidoxydans NBRC 16205 TaxID=1223511 RepID=A0A511DLT6_9PSEU|nr:hypothetical protein [Pseudonocardia sulfidoxydans]GEL24744.1 hypothetical protein PSU4_36980 [Pseudonocardia sulfidoxydans NBRC 16205]
MRYSWRQRLVTAGVALVAVLTLAGVSGCARGPGDAESLAVPTFPGSTTTAGGPGTKEDDGLPDDCSGLMAADDLGAIFAQPVGTVVVRTIRGVPAPSVGRIERVACTYSRAGETGSAVAPLVDVNIGRYTDDAAARNQWKVNSDAERAGATATDVAIGDAAAVVVSRPKETTMLVSYRLDTLTFVLPAAQGGARAPQDVLVDLARRMIPTLVATMPPSSTAPPGPATPAATTSGHDPAAGALGR